MPFRPGLDDDIELQELIRLWQAGAKDLNDRLLAVQQRVQQAFLSRTEPAILFRLQEQVRRLTELESTAQAVIADLETGSTNFINRGGMDRVYAAGAQATAQAAAIPFAFDLPHRRALEVLAKDLYDDVLEVTRFIDDDVKRLVRNVGRELTNFKLTSGTPVRTQARRLERRLASDLSRRGVGSIVYRDGSRHSFGEYAEMLLRTKTGVAYNRGTTNFASQLGIKYIEILDGALCGLTTHHDPELANGLVVPIEVSIQFPLAHPNCRRALNPRPDITDKQYSGKDYTSVQSEFSRADQAAFEEALRQQRASRR